MCYSVLRDIFEEPLRIGMSSVQLEYFAVSINKDLLPDDVDSVPNAPFLVLLFDLEYMGFQIPDILRAQTGSLINHDTRVW